MLEEGRYEKLKGCGKIRQGLDDARGLIHGGKVLSLKVDDS